MLEAGRAGEEYGILKVISGLTKPRQTALLVLSMLAGYVIAGGLRLPLERLAVVVALGWASISATTAINMYFDADIDSLMERTSWRPIPRGIVKPRLVLATSTLILVSSIILGALLVNAWFALAEALGALFDVAAYTLLLKRRTPFSVAVGAVAGSMPAFGGWCAAAGHPSTGALALAMIVTAWIPAHIWYLAWHYRGDYARAGVPMLPVVADKMAVAAAVAFATIFQVYAVAMLFIEGYAGPLTVLYTVASSAYLFKVNMDFASGETSAFKAFKLVNVHLAVLLLLLCVDSLLRTSKIISPL